MHAGQKDVMTISLEFTGERYTPECPREMLYEHYARYAMARHFVAGKRVLDCACGEGYGSDLLAQGAASVLGLDIAAAAVAHARERYVRPNLAFAQGDASALSAELPAASIDAVVSFETLEHLEQHDAMLAGFKRVLVTDGVLLISSPDKATYSDASGYQNEFHVKELYRPELEALLSRHFRHVRLFAQKLVFQSVIWDLASTSASVAHASQTDANLQLEQGLRHAPMYYIAVASDDAAAVARCAGQWHLFSDAAQSLYQHYQAEIRNGIYAAQVIAELRAELARLRVKDAT
jgi:ubiquinone/menaquinone biosynthesis C-methylase UbiE